jgi:hypothetical protein
MSRLEQKAIPVLKPMISDTGEPPLSIPAQAVIALWSVKTAMTLELAKPGTDWFYSDADRHHLLQWHTPPADTTVWIGRYVNGYSLFGDGHKLSKSKAGSLLGEGNSTCLVCGRLVIQIASVKSKSPVTASLTLVPQITSDLPWHDLLFQVWPTVEVLRWPPRLSFGNSSYSIDDLIRRFSSPRV